MQFTREIALYRLKTDQIKLSVDWKLNFDKCCSQQMNSVIDRSKLIDRKSYK